MVQVVKDPIGTKGARLSTQISVAGRLLVHLPQDPHIGVSQRIEDENERRLLRDRLQAVLPAEEKGGFIIRTMAEAATEADMLRRHPVPAPAVAGHPRARRERRRAVAAVPGSLARAARAARLRQRRDRPHPDRLARELRQAAAVRAATTCPTCSPRVQHYAGERPLFDLYNVEEEIEKALARRVDLKSGGYLIIDQTEAMTTVDVNTGGFVGVRNFDDTIFKTNLEAAQVIARQLRLRNLGGIIIIDFIDMENAEHREAVLAEFNKALARDRTKMTVNGFTALGLVEMTRKRTRESLAHVLCEPCRTCGGRGEVKTGAHRVLRDPARDPARGAPVQRPRVPHPRRRSR